MLLRFQGKHYKPIYINPTYVTSITVSDYLEEKYTLVYVESKSGDDPFILIDDIDDVVKQINEAMEPLIYIPHTEDK